MSMSTVNIKIDSNLKKEVQTILKKSGYTLSDAVRIAFYQMKKKPQSFWNKKDAINEALADIKAGRLSRPYTDVQEMINDLMA